MILPLPDHVERLLRFGRNLLRDPPPSAHVLVHCHAGMSRSTAAMTLLLAQARSDRPAADALAEVVRIRPHAWPNLRVVESGDDLPGPNGALFAAARAHYRTSVARDHATGRLMARAAPGRRGR